MLSGSAFLRVTLLLVVAAVTAALILRYLPASVHEPDTEPSTTRAQPAPSAASLARRQEPVPTTTEAPAPPPEPAQPAPRSEPIAAPAPPPPVPEMPAPIQEAPAVILAAPELPQPQGDQAVAIAERTEPRAVDLVDLNTATLAQLNGLRGGGAIGRTIIQNRPYSSIDQLLSKRVLNRATYQRIKDQVTAR